MKCPDAGDGGSVLYYSAVKGEAEAFGRESLARDSGYDLKVILWSGSTAVRRVWQPGKACSAILDTWR